MRVSTCHVWGKRDGGQVAYAVQQASRGGGVPIKAFEQLCDAPFVQPHPYPQAVDCYLQEPYSC